MKTTAPADLQRWSEEVARDASSLSFLPLARAYRRQGRRDAALRICLRGLEHNPDHVEAHSLLAVLYFESGHRVQAYDEWSMVLKLDPDNFDALRGMGFYYLEQENHDSAKRHLERAAVQKPGDPAVQEGLRIANDRLGIIPAEPALPFELVEEPWLERRPDRASHGVGAIAREPAPASRAAVAEEPVARFEFAHAPAPAPARSIEAESDDPSRIFDSLLRGGQVLGALILDQRGLVIGGSLAGSVGPRAESLGAILGGAIEEALRTALHLGLGKWQGVLLEADEAVLHFAPLSDDMIVLLAARKNAPTGWVLRSAAQAAAIARRFVETHL
jgi:predicted regulator of Ras-like GTPase activity (Roadblock/LC7/MglB family)